VAVRVLFLSDTHLGFGEGFFDSFEKALAPATTGETDLVLHGGDLFYRSRIPAWLAERVYGRLSDLADSGVDVFWVPGNHERSSAPRGLFLTHPRVRVFDRPRTFVVERGGMTIALSGFPFAPRVGRAFTSLVAATGHAETRADVKLLCLHQSIEGATVGPFDFVFRPGEEVVSGRDVPAGFAAVLSGHIHRCQVLRKDLSGRPLASPVLFAGSTERTSSAERWETKGAFVLDVERGGDGGRATWEFRAHGAPPAEEDACRVTRWASSPRRP
jgi:DNA repair exonuclease SbcCD nuclease subunit